ncbi:MAG: zf-HC2 domain-containing protein [bacterium]|nr:zf-HC2 domain-containing protein [bacterium]
MSKNIQNQLPCEVVIDLLPLYADEVCSEMSKELVEHHLQECEKCNTELTIIKDDIFQENCLDKKVKNDTFTMKKAMKRFRRKWIISIIATILIMIMALYIVCKVTGTGIEFERCYVSIMNTGNYIKGRDIEKLLVKNEFSDVFDYMNIDEIYNHMQDEMVINQDGQSVIVKEMEINTFKELCRQRFISELEDFTKKGHNIKEVTVYSAKRKDGQNSIKLAISYEDGVDKQQYTEFFWLNELNHKFIYQKNEDWEEERAELSNIFSFEFLKPNN